MSDGLPDIAAATKSIIRLMGMVVEAAMVVTYRADTPQQMQEAFEIGREIAGKARAPFKVCPPIYEIQHPNGGAIMFRTSNVGGDVVE